MADLFEKATNRLKKFREGTPPEHEIIVGAATVGLYTIALLNPEFLPDNIEQAVNTLRNLSLISDYSMVASIIVGGAFVVDGARRFKEERTPQILALIDILKKRVKGY